MKASAKNGVCKLLGQGFHTVNPPIGGKNTVCSELCPNYLTVPHADKAVKLHKYKRQMLGLFDTSKLFDFRLPGVPTELRPHEDSGGLSLKQCAGVDELFYVDDIQSFGD